jgi:hypothetical protein
MAPARCAVSVVSGKVQRRLMDFTTLVHVDLKGEAANAQLVAVAKLEIHEIIDVAIVDGVRVHPLANAFAVYESAVAAAEVANP